MEKQVADNTSPQETNAKFLQFWQKPKEALANQTVEVTFKVENTFYPPTMNSVGSPYLCELKENALTFYSFQPQSLAWKKSLTKIVTFSSTEITSIQLASQIRPDLVLGAFPAKSVVLKVDIVFNDNAKYHLTTKSLAVAKELIAWCEVNHVSLIDGEGMTLAFAQAADPVAQIREKRLDSAEE